MFTSGFPLLTTAPRVNEIKEIHPFFVSVTEMNYNASSKTLEISCKIFTEDFELTLSKMNNSKIDLSNPKNKEEVDKQVADYIKKHLAIKLDGKPVILQFVGFERENEAIWSYFQVANINSPRLVEISNSILYESFTDQINIVHVSVGGNRKSTKLNYPEVKAKFDF